MHNPIASALVARNGAPSVEVCTHKVNISNGEGKERYSVSGGWGGGRGSLSHFASLPRMKLGGPGRSRVSLVDSDDRHLPESGLASRHSRA